MAGARLRGHRRDVAAEQVGRDSLHVRWRLAGLDELTEQLQVGAYAAMLQAAALFGVSTKNSLATSSISIARHSFRVPVTPLIAGERVSYRCP